jgi:glycerophosphoryl diester phosphodiesterase
MESSAVTEHQRPTFIRQIRMLFATASRDMWRGLTDLILYDFLFGTIAFAVLTPLVASLMRHFIATSGDAAIGNFEIAKFLLTPLGLIAMGLFAALTCSIGFARCAGMIYIGYGAATDRRLTWYTALLLAARRAIRILQASVVFVSALAVTLLPFLLAGALVVKWLLTGHDINYYLDQQPPEFLNAVAICGVLLVAATICLAAVSVPLLCLLPRVLLHDEPLRTAITQSRRLVRGGFFLVATTVFAWFVLWFLISFGINSAVYQLGRLVIRFAGNEPGWLLISLAGLVSLSILLNALVSFGSLAQGCLLATHLYRLGCIRDGCEPSLPAESGNEQHNHRRSIATRTTLLMAALLLALLTPAVAWSVLNGVQFEDHVEIAGHRGASASAPENTLSAFRRAIQDGATFVEMDVQLTADGVLVINHDADLMRIAGSPLIVCRSTFEELRKVRIPNPHAADGAPERVPTLDEVIDATKGKIELIVELKTYEASREKLISEVLRTLENRGVLSRSVVMSLEYAEVREVKQRNPQVTVGFVTSAALGDLSKLQTDFLAVSTSQATEALIAATHGRGRKVFVWTVDDPTSMSDVIDRGADCIITNRPAVLVEVLRSRKNLNTAQRILLRFRRFFADH